MELPTTELIIAGKLLLAFLFALPVAINREKGTDIMGLRTFPLVAMGCCAIVLLAKQFIGSDSPGAEARIIQGILSGIGFVGGGAILKNSNQVKGTECAAGIWVTGVMGVAVAYESWTIAITVSLVAYLTMRWLTPFKRSVNDESGG